MKSIETRLGVLEIIQATRQAVGVRLSKAERDELVRRSVAGGDLEAALGKATGTAPEGTVASSEQRVAAVRAAFRRD